MERKLTRRQALGAAGSAGAALLVAGGGLPKSLGGLAAVPAASAATAATDVAITPSMTEGPYWVDELLRRFDVRGNTASAASGAGTVQAGVPLTLKINVLDAASGDAINGAHVDIWHANAYGLYSDEGSQQSGGGTTGTDTQGQNFLRGYQITGVDAGAGSSPVDGQVSFKTIWRGWYGGRAIHIHVRVRTYDSTGTVVTNYTTQIFFSDRDNSAVLTGAAPYNTRSPTTDPTTDETDSVLTSSADATNIVAVAGSIAGGLAATFTIGLAGVQSSTSGADAVDKTVSATLRSATFASTAGGGRRLVLAVRAGETLTATAKLVRGATVIGKATGHLTAGSHTLRVAVPATVVAGAATLRLTLADAAGNTRVFTRHVHVPA
jgi:protocatechuate 3,4-dioxygenase beta subunit